MKHYCWECRCHGSAHCLCLMPSRGNTSGKLVGNGINALSLHSIFLQLLLFPFFDIVFAIASPNPFIVLVGVSEPNSIRFDSICVSKTRALLFLRISLNCSKCVCGMNVVDFCLPHRHFPHTIEYLAKFDTNMCHFALGRNEAEHKAETL